MNESNRLTELPKLHVVGSIPIARSNTAPSGPGRHGGQRERVNGPTAICIDALVRRSASRSAPSSANDNHGRHGAPGALWCTKSWARAQEA